MKVLIAALCSMLMWTACSTAWISDAEQIVAVLIPATANLMTLVATLQGKTVSAADLQMIQTAGAQAGADLQVLDSLILQYEKADTSAQPGLLNQIQVALGAAQSTLGGLLPALHIKDASTQAKVSAVVGLLISEVDSMAEILPMASGATPSMMSVMGRQVKMHTPLKANEFVSSYNATMTAKTGDAALDRATAGLQIHSHLKFERWASAGLLK